MISNIAKNIVSENSENIVIAIWWKRAIAYSLDAIFVVGILFLFTKGQIAFAWELGNLFNNFSDWIIWFLINWILILVSVIAILKLVQ